jgi:adenylosuccinate lyase
MALGKAGADRQGMHERLREHAMQAWEAVRLGQVNPLPERICQDEVFRAYLPEKRLLALLDAHHYVGDAPQRARALAERIAEQLK